MDLVSELLFLDKKVTHLTSRKYHLRRKARALVQKELESRGRNIAQQFGYEKSRGTTSDYILLSMLDLTESQRQAASEVLLTGTQERGRVESMMLAKNTKQQALENCILNLFSQWHVHTKSSEPSDTSYEGLGTAYEDFRRETARAIRTYAPPDTSLTAK